MALINPFMVKSVLASESADSLTLEPDTGRSILVTDILTCPQAGSYLNVKISKTLVGYFRIDSVDLGSHLSDVMGINTGGKLPVNAPYRRSIISQMTDAGIFKGYPIAEGQKMVLTVDPTANLGNTVIVYQEYDAGDITTTMQNGTDATEYVYINYGRFATAPALAGSFVYDDQVTPVEFPEFPFGKVVPAGKTISVNALLASDRVIWDASNEGLATTFYSLKQGRMTMFDEDLRGILAVASTSGLASNVLAEETSCILGEGSHLYRRPVHFFEPPLMFESGEELNVYATLALAGTGSAISLSQSEIGLIQTVKEMG